MERSFPFSRTQLFNFIKDCPAAFLRGRIKKERVAQAQGPISVLRPCAMRLILIIFS
jgi:hypothetical protein